MEKVDGINKKMYTVEKNDFQEFILNDGDIVDG